MGFIKWSEMPQQGMASNGINPVPFLTNGFQTNKVSQFSLPCQLLQVSQPEKETFTEALPHSYERYSSHYSLSSLLINC
jgi:hypothetical protein